MSDHEKRMSHKKATAKLSLQKRSKDVKMQVKKVLEGGAGSVNLNETLEFKKCVKKDAEIKGIGGEFQDKFSYSKRLAHSSNKISEENTGNESLVLPGEGTAGSGKDMDDQTTFCQICHKDLSHMNSQRKSQHVNKCVDKMEQEQKDEEQRRRLLEKAKTAVLDCPLCGKPFKSETSRSSHLKKCAAELGVSTDKMLLLVKKQEEERQIAVAAGIIPNISRSLLKKQPSSSETSVSRKKKIKEPRSQFDEDVQMAMAISSSLAEEKQLLDSDQISITGSTSSSSARETKKSRQKKQEEGEPLLFALSEEEKKKRLSNRVTSLILSQSSQEKENFDCTPVLKESNLGRKKIENQSGSDDQESIEVPGLWTRSILSEKDTANKAVFYVRSLMPPIEISKASAGSRHLPKSPGKCRSVDQDKGAHKLDSSVEPPHAVTKADYDTTSETIIASTQTAIILAELAGDDDGGRNQKDEEESKMSQNSQHNIESSKWFHDHIKENEETEKLIDSELMHASGFYPEELVVPKEKENVDCTPVLKESNLGRKKIENQSGSDDQESIEVPGLWIRSILSEKDTANKAVFYVRSLMPPIEISKSSAGSRHLPKSPGKCRSVDQNKGAHKLDSSTEPPHAVTKADYDTTSETIIASTQTAIILAELAGDDDGGRNQKDEEESKMSQNSQHNIESSKWFHDHIKKNEETELIDSELMHASGFYPEELVVPKEDDALVHQQRLCTDLLRLVNNPSYSDMIIVTKDKQRLHAHRLLLMSRCPALLQICVDGTVLLEESSEETVLALLTYLYTGQLNLTLHILPQLVTLAKRLDLHELVMVCNQMEVSQHIKNTEGDEGNDSNEYRSQGLKDVWGESNSDSEDRNSEMSSNQDDDRDKENDLISAEDYQDIMYSQRRKIGSRKIYESITLEQRNDDEQSEMKDGFGTSRGSEKKESKSDSNQSDVMIGSRNLIKSDKREHDNNSSKSGISSERYSQFSSMEDYTKTEKPVVNTNDSLRTCWLRDKDKFLKRPSDLINYSNMCIPIEPEDTNKRNSALESDMEKRTTDHEFHKEMKSQSFLQQGEFGSEENEKSFLSASSISVGMESSDIILLEDNTVNDSFNISDSKSPSPRRMVRITKGDKLLSSDGQLSDNKNRIYVEHADEKCVSILDAGTSIETTSLVNALNFSVEEHPEKGKKYVMDSGASSISSSPVAFRTSFIQTPEKELDISSDLFSSPTPIKDKKEKSTELSTFRNNSFNERQISTPIRDMDTDVKEVEMNQNIYEMSPFVDSGSKKRKMETFFTDGADKTPKRAASDSKWSKKDIFSSEVEDFNYAKLKIAEQNDGDIEIVGDNFSEMCAQSPTFNDRWKSKWISKDQISDVSISSKQDHFIGKLSDDPDIDKDIKSLELEESVRVIEDSRLVKDNEMVKCAIPSCEGQIVDIKDCPSLNMPTEISTITTNSSQKAAGSVQPVLDEHFSVLADPNVWDDFDDCGAGFGEGIVFTPLKSEFQNNDAMRSQTMSTRKDSFSDDNKVLQHGKTQLTNDNNKKNLSDRGSNTDSDLKGDNLEDSLMNKEEDETAFAEDSFIWMVENMPVDESNPEMKEEKSSSDEQYQKAVNFKTPEAASREMKAKKEWIPPSPFTPMPDYANMSTPMLKKEIDRYGVKPLSKKKMLLMLQEIYHKTHQYETDSEVDVDDTDISASQEENCPSSSQESEISEVIEESLMEEKYTENEKEVPSSPQRGENLTQMMMKFIQDHPEIHIRMLMYEPLELDWLKKQMLDAGIKCSVDKLMSFLDEKCITFTMKNQRKDSRRGRGGKKRQAKTSKESS